MLRSPTSCMRMSGPFPVARTPRSPARCHNCTRDGHLPRMSLRRPASEGGLSGGAAKRSRTRDRITMTDRPSHNLDGLDIDLVRRIDEVCRRFEDDWREGRLARIEDFVVDVSQEFRRMIRT